MQQNKGRNGGGGPFSMGGSIFHRGIWTPGISCMDGPPEFQSAFSDFCW